MIVTVEGARLIAFVPARPVSVNTAVLLPESRTTIVSVPTACLTTTRRMSPEGLAVNAPVADSVPTSTSAASGKPSTMLNGADPPEMVE